MKKIIIGFICTHNSCRSIMAEGYAKHLASNMFEVYSAGTESYPAPKPLAIEVMEDVAIDMAQSYSKLLDEIPSELDILITMGCGVECPFVPTKHREDWGLDDPSGGPKAGFELTRDLIKAKVLDLIERINNNNLKG
ncbi:MAG: arsenate reductase ArsC [Candidatus Izemoplasma sp.]